MMLNLQSRSNRSMFFRPRPLWSRIASTACLLSLACGTGCAKRPSPHGVTLVPVSGQVLFKEQPVEGATIVFIPQDQQHAAAAHTDADGNFTLQTFEPADGAVPGSYQVTVKKFYFIGDTEYQNLPEQYGVPGTSGLVGTISKDGPNHFEFLLHE